MVVEIYVWKTSEHAAVVSMQQYRYSFTRPWKSSDGRVWPAQPQRRVARSINLWYRER